jgi:outer membrane protein assembly factor BamB
LQKLVVTFLRKSRKNRRKKEEKMKKLKNKTAATTIALFLIMTFAATMAIIPLAQAAPNVNIKDRAYVDPEPSKVGVGQAVVVIYGIDHVNPLATVMGPFFEGFTLAITNPAGTTETQSVTVDATSFGHITYTPTTVGTYYFQLSFAGQWVNLTAGMPAGFGLAPDSVNYYYEPATSLKTPLTVQQESVPGVPTVPLPDYWTTPVYSENKNWAAQLDNWLMQGYDSQPRFFNGLGAFSPYTTGPNSPHILWTTQLQEGGLAGAMFPGKSLYPSEVYEQYYIPLIVNGRIYYVDHGPTQTGGQGGTGSNPIDNFGTRCLDLYTGQEVFYLTNVTIDIAQTVDVELPNKHGVIPYLWSIPGLATYVAIVGPPATGLTWEMYDAFTGNQILAIQNATGGFPVFGPKGEILIYTLDFAGKWMSLWNSTRCILSYAPPETMFFSPSRGTVLDWSAGLEWNVTLNAPNAIGTPAIQSISLHDNRVLVLYDNRLFYPTDQLTYPAVFTDCAYPATIAAGTTTVSPVWVQNRTNIYDLVETHYNINEGMYNVYDDSEQKVHTYDISNGNEISVSQPLSNGTLYTTIAHTWMAYGNIYVWSYDGHVRCIEGKTGKILWDTFLGDIPYGQAYSTPPVNCGPTIADGKVYIGGSDHSPDSDMWVGSKLWCLDAYTGEGLWNITGYYGYSAVSNGYLTMYNGYNVKIYTYGKGPSKTTVQAPLTAITQGQSVVITGTVMDQSPGQKDTPCVSDESMGEWMAYLHMQKPVPANVTGVAVSIDVLDANGNYRNIGTATTDMSGTFSFMWKPDIPGKYTVIATFAGSNSYGSSLAEAAFGVTEAAAATPPPQYPVPIDYTLPIVGMGIAIIIAVAIVGILLLRKR